MALHFVKSPCFSPMVSKDKYGCSGLICTSRRTPSPAGTTLPSQWFTNRPSRWKRWTAAAFFIGLAPETAVWRCHRAEVPKANLTDLSNCPAAWTTRVLGNMCIASARWRGPDSAGEGDLTALGGRGGKATLSRKGAAAGPRSTICRKRLPVRVIKKRKSSCDLPAKIFYF